MSRMDEWHAECRMYENTFRAITKRKTSIIEIPQREGEIGYTSSDRTIHLARRHPIMKGLTEEEQRLFRMGTFAHETLHQLLTDFRHLEEVVGRHTWIAEKKTVSLFSNLVEDPAIEYRGELEFGGDLLMALRFTIAHIYRMSPPIHSYEDPFSQLCTALIQFGDMGLLKGHFTSKEAFDMFKVIAPEFNQAIETYDADARIDISEHWMDLTRPLWEKDTEDAESQFLSSIDTLKSDNGITDTDSAGLEPREGQGKDGDEPEGVQRQKERRKGLVKKLEESGKDGSGSPEDEAESTEEEDDKTGASGSEKSDDKSDENGSGTSGSEGEEDAEEGAKEQNTAEASDEGEASSGQDQALENNEEAGDANDDTCGENDNTTSGGTMPPDYEIRDYETEDDGKDEEERVIKTLDSDLLKQIDDTIRRGADGINNRRRNESITLETAASKYGGVTCRNEIMKVDRKSRNAYQAEYADILKKHGRDISLLTGTLRRIFQQDTGETIRSLSGRYNVVRASKQSTAKIFDRKRSPKMLDDLAVMLLIDESGSMSYGNKTQIAKETAIILAESMANLNIPCYIMGFTTGQGCDALHHHFVSWKNTKEERLSLAAISANSSNFDGYAIRNAAMILGKKPAEHKILFVISDGYPACRKYRSMSEGVADTASAILEAKRIATVLGIGIGDCQPEVLKHMYKGSFVHAENEGDLSTVLTKNLKTIIRKF